MHIPSVLKRAAGTYRQRLQLPPRAWLELLRDRQGKLYDDVGPEVAIGLGLEWIGEAQNRSGSNDGGVARDYSLVNGWATSYPETTGYIIPTLLEQAKERSDRELAERARKMLDWLVSIQLPGGGFQGGVIGCDPVLPVTFNTGQILLGLAAGVREFGDVYREPMRRAADWLMATQDGDGCWRRNPSPFAAPGDKVYDAHVAWGLMEAFRLEPQSAYGDGARRNLEWALSQQTETGWFRKCCLSDESQPLTHTLGYVIRGIVEGYRLFREDRLLQAGLRAAEGLRGAIGPGGRLPGRIGSAWDMRADWVCLTGSVQIAICWLLLYAETGDARFRDAATLVNRFVRRTVRKDGNPETRGAVKGSFPVDGGYCAFQYPNWACKFFIDANQMELRP